MEVHVKLDREQFKEFLDALRGIQKALEAIEKELKPQPVVRGKLFLGTAVSQ